MSERVESLSLTCDGCGVDVSRNGGIELVHELVRAALALGWRVDTRNAGEGDFCPACRPRGAR